MKSKEIEVLGVILDIYEYCPENLGSRPRTPAIEHTCCIPHTEICQTDSILPARPLIGMLEGTEVSWESGQG